MARKRPASKRDVLELRRRLDRLEAQVNDLAAQIAPPEREVEASLRNEIEGMLGAPMEDDR